VGWLSGGAFLRRGSGGGRKGTPEELAQEYCSKGTQLGIPCLGTFKTQEAAGGARNGL